MEGAGGVCSPLGSDGDTSRLAALLSPDLVVLVGDACLGTINLVRLSARALPEKPLVVYLNRFNGGDPLQKANRDFLGHDGFDVVTDLDTLADRIASPTTNGDEFSSLPTSK